MSSYYMGDAYLASLAAGAGVGPNEPTNNYKLLQQRNDLIEIRNKLYMGLNSELARYERQQLATEAKLFENVNTTRAKVFESIQQNKRVTAQNATDMKQSLIDAQTALRLKVEGDAPAFDSIQRGFENPQSGQSNIQSAAAAALAWKDAFGKPLSRGNSEIGGVMNRFATLALPDRQNISNITREEFLASLGNITDSQREQLGAMFDAGKERFNEITGALATLDDSIGTVSGIEQSLARTGVSSDPALISQLNNVAASLGPAVSRGIGRSAADIAATQEMFLENNKELQRQQGYIDAMDAKRGQAGVREQMGRIIANPEFRQWAEGNGFRIGSATMQEDGTVTYAPMRDDTKAIALFRYQSETGKHGPMLASTSTDKTVRVTYEDPASREKALAAYGKNGQFFVNERGELMTPAEAEREMNPGNTVQVGIKDDAPVFKMADGRVVDAAGNPASGDGVKFSPGTIDTPTGVRYLAPSDLEGLNMEALGMADTPDLVQSAAKGSAERAGIRTLDEAGAREAWTGVVVGKLDRPNARRIIEEGAGYISLDGGKVTIPASAKATIELMPKGTEVEPLTKAQRLAEADKAAAEAPSRAKTTPTGVPMVTVPNVSAGGVVGQLEVPATSTAAVTAEMEGRPVKPVTTAAPAAPAATDKAPAKAAAPTTEKAYYKDDEGSLFEIDDNGATLLTYKGEKPPAGMKTEFKGDDPALPYVVGNLASKGQRVEAPKPEAPKAEAVAAPKVAPREEGLPAPRMREPEPEPTIGRRAKAAVVVYPEAEGEKKPSILEKVRSLFPRRKKAGEAGEEEMGEAASASTAAGADAGAGAGAGTKEDESKLKSKSTLADLVSGAAAGVPERAPNAAVPRVFAKSAIGARGEGPSTLSLDPNFAQRRGSLTPDTTDMPATGVQTSMQKVAEDARAKVDMMSQIQALRAAAARPTTGQKEPVNMPAQVEMENTGGFTLEGAPRQNLFRADRPSSAIPPKKLSRFNQYRTSAFPVATQE